MPLIASWVNEEKTIILLKHLGRWTWDEIFDVFQEGIQMLNTVDHTVHVLIDHSEDEGGPVNFVSELPRLASLSMPPNVGMLIQVGTTGVTRIGNQMFSRLYHKIYMADTLEEGFALIARRESAQHKEK